MRLIFLFFCLTYCFSCKQKNQVKKFEIKKINSPLKSKKDSTTKKIESLFHDALEKSLMLAKTAGKESFRKKFSTGSEYLNNKVDVEVKFGHLFSQNYKNLFIASSSKLYTKITIYSVNALGFKKLIDQILMTDAYPIWSIKDVNNDGLKDLSINWYPLSGCCMRNIFDLYISKVDEISTTKIELVNPTFFSNEKAIRGVTYDHPGLASLYKFKWNKLNLDTIEYIYPNLSDTIQISFVRSNESHYSQSKKKRSENLKSIPKEYNSVLGLDYFKSYNLEDIKIISKNYNK